jgi:hypothetical protein
VLNPRVKRQAVLIVHEHVDVVLVLCEDELLDPFDLVSDLMFETLF